MPGTGISLGTAMTLSGAAASPNMGYHSSPATAFLMTLFNVRLGAWLPNPACPGISSKEMGMSRPKYALAPLLRELLGLSGSRAPYAYLSDGGHFDNLGLYEMVRRRCRLILISDAGCDLECSFQDLGMAIRKIFIDQQIRIEFPELGICPRGGGSSVLVSSAIGHIHYPDFQGNGPHGYVLYLKPSYSAAHVPVEVRAYAEVHPTFPHESTGDQWFAESQFESYRRLGEFLLSQTIAASEQMDPEIGKSPMSAVTPAEFIRQLQGHCVAGK
jgi:hypothetical protein